MKRRVERLAALALCIIAPAVAAAETSIYESLSEVSIGRVFFSPAERARLDQLRAADVRTAAAVKTGNKSRRKHPKPSAAGFIVRQSGQTRVYRNGDFVISGSKPNVLFSDTVSVKRKDDAKDDGGD